MKKRYILIILIALTTITYGIFRTISFEYAYVPMEDKTLNQTIIKQSIVSDEETGTPKQIAIGKKLFFKETFGNEVFFSDIMGIFNGPLTLKNIAKAIVKLKGQGTSNLKVEAARDFKAGSVTIHKGDLINTGLDVAKGSFTPVGISVVYDKGELKAGISCAACHASVNREGKVVAGLPNSDLNIGLAVAMGTNSAAYFTHTEIRNIQDYIKNAGEGIQHQNQNIKLPDQQKLEEFVDSEIVQWPKGSNDTTIDFKNNPVQIPDSFTLGDHPYGWSGQGEIGPFKGLSAAINNAHSQNMDSLSQTEIIEPVLGINKELYLGTILQHAANKKFRYDINSGLKPSEFFSKVDPTPKSPGVNELIPSASFPRISYLTSMGMLSSSPGFKVWEQINAISAYMNSLNPPNTGLEKNDSYFAKGERVFAKAACLNCHGGKYFTNNRVVKAEEIKTEPSRASSFKGTEKYFSDPIMFAEDTPVPLPKDPKKIRVKLTEEEQESLKLAWAHGNSRGGYKIPSLYGLYWTAPYLHDGGVAVGKDNDAGVGNTLMRGIKADPYNSLRALVDSSLRKKVIEENRSSQGEITTHVTGEGHPYWVDETTGFTKEEQDALIYYLLRLTDK